MQVKKTAYIECQFSAASEELDMLNAARPAHRRRWRGLDLETQTCPGRLVAELGIGCRCPDGEDDKPMESAHL